MIIINFQIKKKVFDKIQDSFLFESISLMYFTVFLA